MFKRLFDLSLIFLTFPLWVPTLILTALLVRTFLGRPVLFRQPRPGKDGQIFELIKFRSMLPAEAADGRALADEERLTRFGRWLRSSSLDELPEIINVLRGEMSLVGPRPLLVDYLEHYTPFQARRHEVEPGITGLAQIMGRNATTWDERFKWDVRYVEERSLLLDLKILILTIRKVALREGVTTKEHTLMPEFAPRKNGHRSGRQPL